MGDIAVYINEIEVDILGVMVKYKLLKDEEVIEVLGGLIAKVRQGITRD